MIQATELRIGNLIEIKCIAVEALEDEFEVQECNIHNLVSIHNGSKDFLFSPIPLTDDWLLRFGFESEDDDNCYFIKGQFEIYNGDKCCYFYWGFASYTEIYHVHQLQNLYYALTQQELKLNDK